MRRRGPGRRWRLPRGLRWLLVALAALALLPPLSDYVLGLRPAVSGCRVVLVVDGDTVDFSCPGEGVVRARIVGFDAPELYSPQCAGEAAAALAAQTYLRWTLGTAEQIKVMLGGVDRYERRLVDVFIDGDRLADRMIASGHGRPYDGGARAGWCA